MSYILERLSEKASHGGLGLITVGVIILVAGGLVDYAAYAAIIYGAYQVITEG
tara:strand:+ start:1016 stop:1174 length:159 start_codon:yes stop_codon:yes gene_type:complete